MFKCKECKKEEDENKFTNGKDLLAKNLCFSCDYWTQRIERQNSLTQAVIKGVVYQIAKEQEVGFRGFDGEKFIIKFKDGRLIHTTNLWYNGKPPSRFKDKLLDNAEFIKDKFL